MKLSKLVILDATDKRIQVKKHSPKRISIRISDEFFTNYYGVVIKNTYAFTQRKSGKWVQVSGTQEIINFENKLVKEFV